MFTIKWSVLTCKTYDDLKVAADASLHAAQAESQAEIEPSRGLVQASTQDNQPTCEQSETPGPRLMRTVVSSTRSTRTAKFSRPTRRTERQCLPRLLVLRTREERIDHNPYRAASMRQLQWSCSIGCGCDFNSGPCLSL